MLEGKGETRRLDEGVSHALDTGHVDCEKE